MNNAPRAMSTNGVGNFVDWLNHTRSMADDPEIFAARKEARLARKARRALAASGASVRPRFRFAGFDPAEIQVGRHQRRGKL